MKIPHTEDFLITIEMQRRDGEAWVRVLLDGNEAPDDVTTRALIRRAMPSLLSFLGKGSEESESC